MQDRNKIHRKGKFNLFDVFVILIIVAVIAAGTVFLTNRNIVDPTDSVTTKIEYQILFQSLDFELTNSPQVNDSVKDGTSGNNLGIISDVQVGSYSTFVKNLNTKTMSYVTVPEKYNVTLTIQSEAVIRNNTIFVDDRKIKISEESILLRSKHFAGSGTCVGIKILDE